MLVRFSPHMTADFTRMPHEIRRQGFTLGALRNHLPARYFTGS